MNDLILSSAAFGVAISVLCYFVGLALKKKMKMAIFNPLLVAVILVMAILLICRIDYSSYYAGANKLSWLLTPATVCLAIPLYVQIDKLKKNLPAILCSVGAGVVTSLGSVFLLCWAFGVDHAGYVTMLPKSITTAIGIGVSEELGGHVAITAAVIILTGIFGNVAGDLGCKLFRITDPIAKGLGIGAASHAIGTSRAMEWGEVEGAMSSLSLVVSGLLTVIGASIFANFI